MKIETNATYQRRQTVQPSLVLGSCLVVTLILSIAIHLSSFSQHRQAPNKQRAARAQQAATTYYVSPTGSDSNPGTKSAPFATVEKAADRVNPGDTVYVRGGRYHGVITINTSGTVESPILFTAFPGEKPVIDGEYSLPTGEIGRCDTVDPTRCFVWDALVRIRGSHIQFTGFEIVRSQGRGMIISHTKENRVHNVVVSDCSIHDTRNATLLIQDADGILIEGCDIYHSGDYAPHDRDPKVLNWPHAVTSINSTYVIYRGNVIHNSWGEGVGAGADSSHITIENNVIYDNHALQVYVHRAKNVTIQRNLMYHTNDANFYRASEPSACLALNNEANFEDSGTVSDVLVYNNIMVGCKRNVAIWRSEGTNAPVENITITNNTLVNAFTNAPDGATGLNIGAGNLKNILIQKNLIYQIDQTIAAAPEDQQIVYVNNLWLREPPAHILSATDIIADPQLTNPNARLVPGGVKIRWYKPAVNSPATTQQLGAFEFYTNDPPEMPTPFATATPITVTSTPTGIPPTATATFTPMPTPTPTIIPTGPPTSTRVSEGIEVLYTFDEGSGIRVYDKAENGTPLDLIIENSSAVTWLTGTLSVRSPVKIVSVGEATRLVSSCIATNAVTLEVWVRPVNTTQNGPARIVTLSKDIYNRNIMLGQGLNGNKSANLYDTRLRTTESSVNGEPSLSSPAGSLATKITHVVFTHTASGQNQLYVDGTVRSTSILGGDFSNWDSSYRLVLANELTEPRPWLGDLLLVAIYCRALTQQEVLSNFWAGYDTDLFPKPTPTITPTTTLTPPLATSDVFLPLVSR
jgi:hypothetical protein